MYTRQMTQSMEKLLQLIKDIERQRAELLEYLSDKREYAVGSVSAVNRKCGKPNCHCADGKGHPQIIFLFKDTDGRRICKLVRTDDADRITEAGNNYKTFRSKLKILKTLHKKLEVSLVAILRQRAIRYE